MGRRLRKNQPAMAVDPVAFPTDLHDRVIVQVGTAEQVGAFLQPQRRVGFQFDAADEIFPGRHHHRAAVCRGARIDGLLKGAGVLGHTVADGAEFADVESTVGEHGATGLAQQGENDGCKIDWFHGEKCVRFHPVCKSNHPSQTPRATSSRAAVWPQSCRFAAGLAGAGCSIFPTRIFRLAETASARCFANTPMPINHSG